MSKKRPRRFQKRLHIGAVRAMKRALRHIRIRNVRFASYEQKRVHHIGEANASLNESPQLFFGYLSLIPGFCLRHSSWWGRVSAVEKTEEQMRKHPERFFGYLSLIPGLRARLSARHNRVSAVENHRKRYNISFSRLHTP